MWINIPAGFIKLLNNPKYNWNFESEPEPNAANRRIPIPRGRTLGGSSSINGMLYVRGNPLDYNTWSQFGNRRLGLRLRAALFQESRAFRPRRRRDARPRRAAACRPHARTGRTARCVHRRRGGRRISAQQGLQQRPPGRLRLLPGDAEERRALVHRARLPRSGPQPPQPEDRNRSPDHEGPAGWQARRRRRLHPGRRGQRSPCPARSDRLAPAR